MSGLDQLIGDVVLWSRRVGPVTEIRFRSGRALFLVDLFPPSLVVV